MSASQTAEATATYAWIIDTDHLYDAEVAADSGDIVGTNEANVIGPSAAPDDLVARLTAGEGRTFRMYDDDGELYYTGRILVDGRTDTAWTDSHGADEDFGPLWDFGTPNAGAVAIAYQQGNAWVTL